jgi:hypothetical protein
MTPEDWEKYGPLNTGEIRKFTIKNKLIKYPPARE